MKKTLINGISFVIALVITSCEKPEGFGGSSSISGTVSVELYDKDFKNLQATYPAVDEDVFIIYGENATLSDELNTSNNGMYRFENLTKGNYTLFVYSEDKTQLSLSDITIDTTLKLSANDDVIENINFTVYKTIDYDDGQASISGKVLQVNYSKDFIFVIDTTYAQELDVYLSYEGKFIDRTRTLSDGSYHFDKLLKGEYEILVYSDDFYNKFEKKAQTKIVSIGSINDQKSIETIHIANED